MAPQCVLVCVRCVGVRSTTARLCILRIQFPFQLLFIFQDLIVLLLDCAPVTDHDCDDVVHEVSDHEIIVGNLIDIRVECTQNQFLACRFHLNSHTYAYMSHIYA